ncbi:hypothetical protein LOAG_02005 [Loa loa]|uniref:Uncharacterized protein n=1 Tax=Loa loa TaxID=7209 RepID=A0A1S0U7W4_LOALO|nr:hypothetical protein LOAG_02005 [Loa loa]EFO26489.1 hypothetical protein LOAG_02005 [Loa loa]
MTTSNFEITKLLENVWEFQSAKNLTINDGNMTVLEISDAIKIDETLMDNMTSFFNPTEIESLCLRMHNNTAFMGVQPIARLVLYSASECRRNCVDLYPKCAAAQLIVLVVMMQQ